MTLTEQRAWLALLVAAATLIYLIANMTDGWSVPDQDARHLWRTWLTVLGFGIAAETAIGLWDARRRQRGALEDERDLAIAARADRIGGLAAFAGLNVLVWQVLWQASFEGGQRGMIGPDLTHIPTLVFALLGLLLASQMTRQAAVIALSRL